MSGYRIVGGGFKPTISIGPEFGGDSPFFPVLESSVALDSLELEGELTVEGNVTMTEVVIDYDPFDLVASVEGVFEPEYNFSAQAAVSTGEAHLEHASPLNGQAQAALDAVELIDYVLTQQAAVTETSKQQDQFSQEAVTASSDITGRDGTLDQIELDGTSSKGRVEAGEWANIPTGEGNVQDLLYYFYITGDLTDQVVNLGYEVRPPQFITNWHFAKDLSGWTEVIDSGNIDFAHHATRGHRSVGSVQLTSGGLSTGAGRLKQQVTGIDTGTDRTISVEAWHRDYNPGLTTGSVKLQVYDDDPDGAGTLLGETTMASADSEWTRYALVGQTTDDGPLDSSGNGHTLTENGDPQPRQSPVGKFGSGYDLDGDGDYLSQGDDAYAAEGDFALFMVIDHDELEVAQNEQTFVRATQDSNESIYFGMTVRQGQGTLNEFIYEDDGDTNDRLTGANPIGVYSAVSVRAVDNDGDGTRTITIRTFNEDGSLRHENVSTRTKPSLDGTPRIAIGATTTGGEEFDGGVFDVQFWNGDLTTLPSQAELDALADPEDDTELTGQTAYWKMENTDFTVADNVSELWVNIEADDTNTTDAFDRGIDDVRLEVTGLGESIITPTTVKTYPTDGQKPLSIFMNDMETGVGGNEAGWVNNGLNFSAGPGSIDEVYRGDNHASIGGGPGNSVRSFLREGDMFQGGFVVRPDSFGLDESFTLQFESGAALEVGIKLDSSGNLATVSTSEGTVNRGTYLDLLWYKLMLEYHKPTGTATYRVLKSGAEDQSGNGHHLAYHGLLDLVRAPSSKYGKGVGVRDDSGNLLFNTDDTLRANSSLAIFAAFKYESGGTILRCNQDESSLQYYQVDINSDGTVSFQNRDGERHTTANSLTVGETYQVTVMRDGDLDLRVYDSTGTEVASVTNSPHTNPSLDGSAQLMVGGNPPSDPLQFGEIYELRLWMGTLPTQAQLTAMADPTDSSFEGVAQGDEDALWFFEDVGEQVLGHTSSEQSGLDIDAARIVGDLSDSGSVVHGDDFQYDGLLAVDVSAQNITPAMAERLVMWVEDDSSTADEEDVYVETMSMRFPSVIL